VTGFLGAVQFLTRIPIHLRSDPGIARSVPWFPVVGALIGLAVGGIAAGLWDVVPPLVGAGIAVLAGVLVTGAFHEDGLADIADGLGGYTPEQRREILKDSRHGSYGVVAMTGSILLRVACVASLAPAAAVAGLVAAHALGRAGSVGVMLVSAAPSAPGLGSDYISDVRRGSALAGIGAGVAITALATGWWVLPLAAGVVVAAAAVRRLVEGAYEGMSGDGLGAAEQAGEIIVLVIVSGLAAQHTLWWA
jgi:adenosylcobinamide-GDP ribazoletransferase